MPSLSDSIPTSNSPALSPDSYCAHCTRAASPHRTSSPRAVLTSAVRARTSPARRRIDRAVAIALTGGAVAAVEQASPFVLILKIMPFPEWSRDAVVASKNSGCPLLAVLTVALGIVCDDH